MAIMIEAKYMSKGKEKVEVIYFYSSLYESKKTLMPIVRKIRRERKNISVRLVDVDEPRNVELTELYNVNRVPLVIFLTPKGEIASRKSASLTDEIVINTIIERVINGDLPKPHVNEIKKRILDLLKSVPRRNELMQLMIEQMESDVLEADSEDELHDTISLYISTINHIIRDLEECKKALQVYIKGKQTFIV